MRIERTVQWFAGLVLLFTAISCNSGTDKATGENTPRDSETRGGGLAREARAGGDVGGGLPRVVFLGTSLTAGQGLAPEQAYPALLQAKADSLGYRVEVVNAGLSGETSAGALRRVKWVLRDPAVLVVLEVGANDGLRGVNPDSVYSNLVRLIEEIRATQPSAAIALIQMEAPTNLGASYTSRFGAVYRRAARSAGVELWPFLLDGVAGVSELNQTDGIHPNVEGERRVAATVWGSLGPKLAKMGLSGNGSR